MSTKTHTLKITVTAPAVMGAAHVKREVFTRLRDITGHYDAHDFDLSYRETTKCGAYIRMKFAPAKPEKRTLYVIAHSGDYAIERTGQQVEVERFWSEKAYQKRLTTIERLHEQGKIDSYTDTEIDT